MSYLNDSEGDLSHHDPTAESRRSIFFVRSDETGPLI